MFIVEALACKRVLPKRLLDLIRHELAFLVRHRLAAVQSRTYRFFELVQVLLALLQSLSSKPSPSTVAYVLMESTPAPPWVGPLMAGLACQFSGLNSRKALSL